MPEIVFKGKEYVYNHHLTVPYRPLLVDAAKGIGPGDLNSNLVVHGDNLHALKALLPRYGAQVDLVFIDPPYNTGNEGWCYSDGVNSPIMKEWLSTNPVDGDDMLRHDKWLCMMWPRLVLLRELMSEAASIWITLDDHEVHHARMVLDEIFGADNFVVTCIWQKKYSPQNDAEHFSPSHDYLLVYAKAISSVALNMLQRTDVQDAAYKNLDNDTRGIWKSSDLTRPEHRDRDYYGLITPSGREVFPAKGRSWSRPKEEIERLRLDGRLWFGKDGAAIPSLKRFLSEVQEGVIPQTIWGRDEVGDNQEAKQGLKQLFGDDVFATPKPVRLLERILELASTPESIVLDSFAGSGTTAHAVLKANARDQGNRKFILVEGEDYADRLTAERVRRAIRGYAWQGTQRETLLEEKINLTQFKKAEQWLARVDAIKRAEGFAEGDLADQEAARKKRFDSIAVELKGGVLRAQGEKRVSEMVDGLGGEFTYCTLGEPLSVEKLLSGQDLPSFEALGAWLLHTATGGTLSPASPGAPEFYLSEAQDVHVWLIYRPELAFLKSADAALTLSRAQAMVDWARAQHGEIGVGEGGGAGAGKRHLVFAPAKFMSHAQLRALGVEFAALPFVLYRQG